MTAPSGPTADDPETATYRPIFLLALLLEFVVDRVRGMLILWDRRFATFRINESFKYST